VTDDADDLDRRLARLFETGRREDPKEHPAPEKLSAYQANELPPEEADAIQEHLVQCAFCTDLLLELKSFLEPAEEDRAREGVADLGAEVGWRKVRAEMDWREEPAPVEVSRLRRRLWAFQAIAAVLLAGVVGLSVYSWQVREKARRFDPNPVSASVPSNLGTRSGVEPTVIQLPRGTETRVLLTLEGSDVEYPEFRADIRRKGGRSASRVPGLQLRDGVFRFTMDSEGLEPGTYDIEVYGLRNGNPIQVGQYTIQIERR
jgi:Putative zinc-finger